MTKKKMMVAVAERILEVACGYGYWTKFTQPEVYVAPTPGTFLPGLRVGDKVFEFFDDGATMLENTVVYVRDGAGYIVDETADRCSPSLLLVSDDYRATRQAAIQHWRKDIVSELESCLECVAKWQEKVDRLRALLSEEQ